MPLFLRHVGAVGADEDILGRVGQIDELEQGGLIPGALQQAAAYGVGHKGGGALFDYAIAGQGRKAAALYLGIELVLAAGDREYHLCAPADGVIDGVVGGRVAGMEGYDHVGGLFRPVTGDIAQPETKAGIAVVEGGQIALGDDVGLEIEADDRWVQAADLGQVIIEYKGQIGLAAAEVDYRHVVPAIGADGVVDKLDEPVDLAVFVVHPGGDPALGGENAEVDQRGYRRALGQEVILLLVVALFVPDPARAGRGHRHLALFRDTQGAADPLGKAVELAEALVQQPAEIGVEPTCGDVVVKDLLVGVLLGLKIALSTALFFVYNYLAEGAAAAAGHRLKDPFGKTRGEVDMLHINAPVFEYKKIILPEAAKINGQNDSILE